MIHNIFSNLPATGPEDEEEVVELFAGAGARIERIVSTGQASPEGFFYDQDMDEWVVLLSGAARLLIEGEPAPRELGKGDTVFLPAHLRHRVEWTSPDEPTIWLAVHLARDTGA